MKSSILATRLHYHNISSLSVVWFCVSDNSNAIFYTIWYTCRSHLTVHTQKKRTHRNKQHSREKKILNKELNDIDEIINKNGNLIRDVKG